MLKQIFKYKWYLLVVPALIIAEPTLNSVMNFLLQRMFNATTPGGNIVELLRLLSEGFLLWMIKRAVIHSNGVIKARFICNAKRDIKHQLFVRMIGLDTANLADVASSLFSLATLGTSFVALNAKLAVPIISFGLVAMFVPAFFLED